MTLPIYLAVHLVYGALMAHVMMRRMRAEGEVVGVPLLYTVAPVGLLTAPLGAILLRYSGGWFVHGLFVGDGSVGYERFHFGLMLLCGVLAGVMVVAGMFFAVAMLSRDRPSAARAPYFLGAFVALLTVALDARDVAVVAGTGGRLLVLHPAGAVSVAVLAVLGAAYVYGKRKVATVMPAAAPGAPKSIIAMPLDGRLG